MLEKALKQKSGVASVRRQHSSISLENFVGGEGFDEVVVQVAAVRALLDVAVLGEILHADSHVHHRLAAVFAVEASLKKKQGRKPESSGWISLLAKRTCPVG